jgi:uncharacterized protein (DUF58 family)
MRIRPVVRPSLVMLLFLFVAASVVPAIDVSLPISAFVFGVMINFAIAWRHVLGATFALAVPPIGRVGEPMNWSITTPDAPRAFGGWLLVGASISHRVPLVPQRVTTLPVLLDRRGVFGVAQLHLISVGPLFLPLHASRKVHRDLLAPLIVAPQLQPVEGLLEAVIAAQRLGEGESDSRGYVPGAPESIRPFERGDRLSAVDWRATARTGNVHVKQFERLGGSNTVTVIVEHIDGSSAGERMLSEATWLIHELIGHGVRVELATATLRIHVGSQAQADEVLAGVEPGICHSVPVSGGPGPDSLRVGHGLVRVLNGYWTVDSRPIVPAARVLVGGLNRALPTAAVVS